MCMAVDGTTGNAMTMGSQFPGGGILYNSTGELANHYHGANVSNTNIYGTFDAKWTNSEFPASGVFSITSNNNRQNGRGIDTNCGSTVTFNSTHSHTVTVNSTGSGTRHENRQPYQVINRWKRTA